MFKCATSVPFYREEDDKDVPTMYNPDCPVYDVPSGQYSVESILSMLLEPDESKVCSQRPTNITGSSTFILDLDKLAHPDDAKKDNFGKWSHSGSHTVAFRSWFADEGEVRIERVDKDCTASDVQYLRRIHSYHPSDSTCKRMLAFVTGTFGEM